MVSNERWKEAQTYEQGYWEGVAEEAASGDGTRIGFYRWRAGELATWLDSLGLKELTGGEARVVEIGSGPIGVVGYFPARSRIAVDPLEDFYSSREALVEVRSSEVSYRQGTGEALPVEDDSADMVVIENCIDHCQDMDAVMDDIRRVLRPGGYLYLTVNARSRPGYYVHRFLSSTGIDAGHPHTFTLSRVGDFIRRHGFGIVGLKHRSLMEAWKEDLAGPGLKPRIKALMGVSEFLVSVVAKMEPRQAPAPR